MLRITHVDHGTYPGGNHGDAMAGPLGGRRSARTAGGSRAAGTWLDRPPLRTGHLPARRAGRPASNPFRPTAVPRPDRRPRHRPRHHRCQGPHAQHRHRPLRRQHRHRERRPSLHRGPRPDPAVLRLRRPEGPHPCRGRPLRRPRPAPPQRGLPPCTYGASAPLRRSLRIGGHGSCSMTVIASPRACRS